MYLFFFSSVSSVPALFWVINNDFDAGSTPRLMSYFVRDCSVSELPFFFLLLLVVKLPLFPLHFWLPRAHTEASTFSSMLLARVILKISLAGYILWGPRSRFAVQGSISLLMVLAVFSSY